ncbi:hypothetical protein [Helicobacter typhlonius]|uniref:hypothetical protein n=1 Tax=Helicobacter typhlonius TaxID=76936 RepID=UPI002FE07663
MKFLLINTNQIVQKLVEITAKKAGAKITSITESSKMGDLTQYDYVIIDDDCLLLDEQTYIDSLKDKHKCLIYNKGTKRIEGFDDYIQKPFLPTSILDIFTEQLKKNAHIADEESDLLAGEDISLDNLDDSLDKIDSLLAEEDSLDEPTKTDISIEDKTNDDILGDEELGADVAEDSITDEATAEDDKSSESTEDVDVSLDDLDVGVDTESADDGLDVDLEFPDDLGGLDGESAESIDSSGDLESLEAESADILGDEELGADVAEDSITDEATAEDDKSSESTEDVDVSLDASLDESTQDEADLSGDDLFDDEEKLSLEDDVSKSVFDEEQVSEVSQALNALEEPSMGGGDDDFSALKEPEIAQALGEDIPDLGEDTQEMDDVLENSQGAEDSMDLDSVESAHIESISQDSQETSTSQEFVKNIIASSVQSSIANLRNDNLKSMLDGLEVTINISFKDKSK